MIDSKLQEQLRERFNPDGSLLRLQQLRMLEILLYIDKVCKENDIKYWLSSGTLLGAVRHGGFIPWDDDLDIEMLREDYDKFINLFPNNDNYALQTPDNEINYLLPFAKVRDKHSELDEFGKNSQFKYKGIFVDVFCLEESHRIIYVIWGVLFYWLQKTQQKSTSSILIKFVVLCKKFLYGILSLVGPLLKRIPNKSLNHACGAGPRWKSRNIKHIFPLKEMLFEGYSFPVPNNYEAYLEEMYSNFRNLPNLDKVRIHCCNCYFS